jgi:hypothetical protein
MITDALTTLRQHIIHVAQQFNRSPESIRLLAVSKTRPITDILTAIDCGQHAFGENYLQEALPKIQALRHYPLEWHFIGPLQSNKTRPLAEHFDWVQSITSLKQAQRLSKQRPHHLPPLNICIQVNISEEPQKSGIDLSELFTLAQAITQLPQLCLRGLMTIPAPTQDFNQQRLPFYTLHQAYQQLQSSGILLDTLSMGMTDDMNAAIAEGATLLRIGTGIFGTRSSY